MQLFYRARSPALSTDWNGKHQCFTLLLPPGKMRPKTLARAPAQRCARAAPLRVKRVGLAQKTDSRHPKRYGKASPAIPAVGKGTWIATKQPAFSHRMPAGCLLGQSLYFMIMLVREFATARVCYVFIFYFSYENILQLL